MADEYFTPQAWLDFPETATPIKAARLNRIEQGIADNDPRNPTSKAAVEVQRRIEEALTGYTPGGGGGAGESAYQIAQRNGFDGNETEWLASLIGADGASAYEVAVANGYVGTPTQWLATLAGAAGKSAYQIAVDNGYTGTVTEWLASLKGQDGGAANFPTYTGAEWRLGTATTAGAISPSALNYVVNSISTVAPPAGTVGPGWHYYDKTLKEWLVNTGTLAAPIWSPAVNYTVTGAALMKAVDAAAARAAIGAAPMPIAIPVGAPNPDVATSPEGTIVFQTAAVQ